MKIIKITTNFLTLVALAVGFWGAVYIVVTQTILLGFIAGILWVSLAKDVFENMGKKD